MTSSAERIAWIIVIIDIDSFLAFEQLFPLSTQVRGHVLVHVVEHGGGVVDVARGERAVTLRDLLRRDDLVFGFSQCAGVLVVGPRADADEVLLQPSDRIAKRK